MLRLPQTKAALTPWAAVSAVRELAKARRPIRGLGICLHFQSGDNRGIIVKNRAA